MKKLMIAAVAGVLAVAANADTYKKSCVEELVCPYGYQIKIFVKTTGAGGVIGGDCGDKACLRVPATRRLAGFIYGSTAYGPSIGKCGELGTVCDCNAWNEGELLLWNYDTKKEAMPKTAKIVQLDRIYAGDATTVEMAFKFEGWDYDFNLAGFGRVAKRNDIWTLKFAQGFCAGVIPAPNCNGDCGETAPARVWAMCGYGSYEKSYPVWAPKTTAAYGKWTIDWSSSVYNRVSTGLDLTPGAGWDKINAIPFKGGKEIRYLPDVSL